MELSPQAANGPGAMASTGSWWNRRFFGPSYGRSPLICGIVWVIMIIIIINIYIYIILYYIILHYIILYYVILYYIIYIVINYSHIYIYCIWIINHFRSGMRTHFFYCKMVANSNFDMVYDTCLQLFVLSSWGV